MRLTLALFIFSSICLGCKAQIIPIGPATGNYGDVHGAYYKDVNGLLDPFIGHWKYSSSTEIIEIKIKKLSNQIITLGNINYSRDILIGTTKYLNSGVLIYDNLNTITQINSPAEVVIRGNLILRSWDPLPCDTCAIDELRISLDVNDPLAPHIPAEMIMRIVPNTNGQQVQLKYFNDNAYVEDPNNSNGLLFDDTERIFIKQ